LNDIGNIAFYASIAIVGYIVCRAFSPRLGRDWLVICGAGVCGLVICWIVLTVLPFQLTANRFVFIVIPLGLASFAAGGVLGYWLMVRLTEPKK
jgi:hypothetical protein